MRHEEKVVQWFNAVDWIQAGSRIAAILAVSFLLVFIARRLVSGLEKFTATHAHDMEAKRRAAIFLSERLPKFMRYFERAAAERFSYVHLSLFQMIEGLRYAFPRTMEKVENKYPKLVGLHDRVAQRPRLAAYLSSKRRVPFNPHGIFRHYPELDDAA